MQLVDKYTVLCKLIQLHLCYVTCYEGSFNPNIFPSFGPMVPGDLTLDSAPNFQLLWML